MLLVVLMLQIKKIVSCVMGQGRGHVRYARCGLLCGCGECCELTRLYSENSGGEKCEICDGPCA